MGRLSLDMKPGRSVEVRHEDGDVMTLKVVTYLDRCGHPHVRLLIDGPSSFQVTRSDAVKRTPTTNR